MSQGAACFQPLYYQGETEAGGEGNDDALLGSFQPCAFPPGRCVAGTVFISEGDVWTDPAKSACDFRGLSK